MEKNRKHKKVKNCKKMARGKKAPAPLEPVSASEEEARTLMPPPPIPVNKEPLEQPEPSIQHMVALKPKFLPNLRSLVFPKMVYEQAKRLVITPLMTYSHDAAAATKLRGARCPSFELPKDMFPSGAPIWKITFLPEELLPMGFDAGGVFATGVLARKYYPTDLLSADHKGQTPPLFIGHRNSSYILPPEVQAQAKGNGNGGGQTQAPPKRIQPLTPAPPPSPPYRRSILKPNASVTDDMNRRLLHHNITVIEIVIMPTYPKPQSNYPMAAPMQMQCNMYAPDLSKVIFATQEIKMTVVAILSTVHQPNVPEVAMATMDNETCPMFELPADIFPVDINRPGPRFLPQRFLPDFCDAGCVFPPGSLPDSVFHGAIRTHYDLEQHHYSMTPPLFVGQCKQQQEQPCDNGTVQVYKIDPVAMQLKKLALRNMAATKKDTTKIPVPLPEGTKRSHDFKLAAQAGKPKGFVLIESDHVPRGAIPTDFFGAFLMGCFFMIAPNNKGVTQSSSESEDDEEDEQEFLDFQNNMFTMVKLNRGSLAGVPAVEKTEVQKAEVKEPETEESEAELNSEEYETEEYLDEDCESEGYEAEEIDTDEYEAEVRRIEEIDPDEIDTDEYEAEEVDPDEIETDEYEADEDKTEELDPDEIETDEYEAEEGKTQELNQDEIETDEYEADEGKIGELNPIEIETYEYKADEGKTKELNQGDIETDEYEPVEAKTKEVNQDEIETDEYEPVEANTKELNQDDIETDEYDPEQADGKKPKVVQKSDIAEPPAKEPSLKRKHTNTDNEYTNRIAPDYTGCDKVYSYFTIDSNLDDIAEAAGDLTTARFEVIVHASELPGIDVNRAVEQFRQVLQCRNEIRAKMTGLINAHDAKMEADHKVVLVSPVPEVNTKRVFRKTCSQCGKNH
ncbi:DM7 family protein GG19680-like [Drosophila serrata]|uniref:DM7 family protein GG19680-like n=1 Tax=Drosophila serrata TaxID=7274 RepID=UPI000A1CF5E1|nr:DM7 family protein GG19680-like [Drosophila serrata]